MRVKINFVFFVCFKNAAILANVGKNVSDTDHGTSTNDQTISDSTKSIVTETGVSDFAAIRYRPDFVDRSLLIDAVFCGYERIVLRSPPRTGKTVNISMLKRFFEYLPDEAALEANRKLFEGLQIGKYKSTMKDHFGKHPILFMDFESDRKVDSHKDSLEFFRDVLHRTFKSHAYLRTSNNLEDEDKSYIEEWLDDGEYRTFNSAQDIFSGFRKLTRYMLEHFHRRIFILIDNYDSVWSEYVGLNKRENKEYISPTNQRTIRDISVFYTGLLESLIVYNEANVARTIFTGVHSLRLLAYVWSPGHDLRKVWIYNCPRNPVFSQYYGNCSTHS